VSSTRSELQKKARSGVLQQAFFRWESAVVLAGTIVLTGLLSRPFSWWPVWGWPLLGLLGLVALLYSGLTDAEAKGAALLALFEERFDPHQIQDLALRREVEATLEYQRQIEERTWDERPGALRDWLEDTAGQLWDWVANIYELAQTQDLHHRGELLPHERETVLQETEELAARRRLEQDPVIRRELDAALEVKETQWQAMQDLDVRMAQVELELQESMTALASIHSQVELVDSGDVRSGRAELLEADIRNQVDRLSNLTRTIAQQRQRISDAASGGSFSI
jgi:hypothetical protein